MSVLSRRLLHVFYPNRCPVCSSVIGAMDRFCPECSGRLVPWKGSFSVTGADSFSAAFVYGDSIRPAVTLLKSGRLGNSAYALALSVADAIGDNGIAGSVDVIVPVPMLPDDVRKRGYNQAEIICRILGDRIGVPVAAAAEKFRVTLPQKELSKKEREINLMNAFRIPSPDLVKNKRVLLVDDVCTTGSTLAEITRVLRIAGAAQVHCACACKTPDIKNQST